MKKKLLCLALCLLLLEGFFLIPRPTAADSAQYMGQERSAGEIAAQWNAHMPRTGGELFAVEPAWGRRSYTAGLLTQNALTNGINMLNYARWLCGLEPVELAEDYNNECQAGALLLAALGSGLSHTPARPHAGRAV
ncbi:MAG: hypothetical protein FWD16_01310 [Clostridia bacterium]|nr:hypothetical protein [Clostridia bacterium]